MATFVSNKIRAFQTPGNTCDLPTNSESIFHLKSYDSATDPRAWALESNDRKSYILDLFTADNPKPQEMYLGKYVNLHVLMRTLMSNKEADIKYLQSQLNLLEAFLDDLNLDENQRNSLQSLKQRPIGSMINKFPSIDSFRCSEETLMPADDAIQELNQKFQEQEQELQEQRELAANAINQISFLKQIVKERDSLKDENDMLKKSLDGMRNTKSSSNNDLHLKAKISDLKLEIRRKDIRKLNNLKMVRSDQIAIFPVKKATREAIIMTHEYENYNDMKQIIEERNILQETVGKLLTQMENLQKFDQMIEQQLPGRHDSCPGDHASQICQTIPNLQVEFELKKEIEYLKQKLSDFEIKNLEFDRLCLRISELQLIQEAHEEMKEQFNIQFLEQKTSISQYLNKIAYLKEQCSYYEAELERFKKCEDENNILAERCKNLQNIIENQQGRVRYLENCKSLVVESESLNQINQLKQELDKKSCMIKVSENKLLNLQTQLRDSINNLTCETSVLKNSLQEAHNRITGLLEQDNLNHILINQLKEELTSKNMSLQALEQERYQFEGTCKPVQKVVVERENIIQQLRGKLLDLQRDNDRLKEMSCRLHNYILGRSFSQSILARNNLSSTASSSKCVDAIHQAMRQLQIDLSAASMACDAKQFSGLQSRYKEIQSLAKGQVHWLANGLRKCKEQVYLLQCQFKHEE
ncbi:coiled-coil domain-containing protein 186-like isoform X2 [Atheta coriaria]|uniref:coiled-coil domain-containing protein 186-like isoform X2 n=1 Tax=Dalotia coriaria TaxID=877792 RepID=UPI0031F3EC63